jgi:hypothetical protein
MSPTGPTSLALDSQMCAFTDSSSLILLDPYEPWNEVVFKWTELVQHVSMVVQANPSHGQTAGKSSIEACSLSNTETAMATATGTSATGRRRVATRTSARTTARTRTRTTRRRTSTTTTTRQRVATAAPAATKTRKVVPTTLPTADEADAADEQDMAIEYA